MGHHEHFGWFRQHPLAGLFGREESGRGDFAGRGGPWHGRGGRRGGPGFFGFAPGGPGGFDFRAGRKLSSADLQLLLLALLGEQGRHGYDLIKAIEERSKGFYVPSPGVIYPALTYLEEAGDAVAEAKGSRKLYELTDTGRANLESRRAEADQLLAQLDELGRRMGRLRDAFSESAEEEAPEGPSATKVDFRRAIHDLMLLLRHRGAREHTSQIVAVLRRAASEIERILDEEPSK